MTSAFERNILELDKTTDKEIPLAYTNNGYTKYSTLEIEHVIYYECGLEAFIIVST